jgi:D123
LPASSPLKCVSPADVYLLLKSSDFVSHDLDREAVFAGCDLSSRDGSQLARAPPSYDLELVLRKWYLIDHSRELRCFVRQEILLGAYMTVYISAFAHIHLLAHCHSGISQRDTNFYEFLNEPAIRNLIISTVTRFWEREVKGQTGNDDCESRRYRTYTAHSSLSADTFDILLTRDLTHAHVLDFNPYAPRTDSLLFTYENLLSLLTGDRSRTPLLMVIDSPSHPAAKRAIPTHQHNMVPFEALSLSSGKDIDDFADLWREEIKKSLEE